MRAHSVTRLLVVGTAFAIGTAVPTPARSGSHKPLESRKGIVAADHPIASRVGARVLAEGGNAADAAAATALALGVVNPMSSGIGGGGFAVVYVAAEDKTYVLDFREVAPAALDPSDFVRDGEIDSSLSQRGGLAVAVPGEVAGLEALVTRFGRKPFADAVAPAERLARRGFPAGTYLAESIDYAERLRPHDRYFERLLMPGGKPLREGQRVRRPKLARALAAIRKQGAAAFYRGWIARDIVARVKAAGGVMTLDDLRGYRVAERAPLIGTWRDKRIVTMPLPSSGGLILLAAFSMLDASGFDLGANDRLASATLHALAEVFKHVFADRARFLGDVDHSDRAMQGFLRPARLRALAERIHPYRVLPIDAYGDQRLGDPTAVPADAGTSHLCAIDADGNAVALTTTVNLGFGAGIVTRRSGIVLNDEVDDFALEPGAVNAFGLVQSEANLVGAGKRPLSSMTPTLVFEGNRIVACAGGAGGPRIISGTFQVLLNALGYGMNAREAVETPRVHHQWRPDRLRVEAGVPMRALWLLLARGHDLISDSDHLATVQLVLVRDDGVREAWSDPRKHGAPAAEDSVD